MVCVLGGTTCSALLEKSCIVVVRGRAILAPHEPPAAAPRARASHRLLLLSMLLLLLLALPCRRRRGNHALVPYSYSASSHVSPSVQSQPRPVIVVGEIEPLGRAPERVLLVLVLLVRVHEPRVVEEGSVVGVLRLRPRRLPCRRRTTRSRVVVGRLAR